MSCPRSSIRTCSISLKRGSTFSVSAWPLTWRCASVMCGWPHGRSIMNPIRLPPEPRVLVVALRRLGDVLLTTPLIRSVKRAYPGAAIEALVFAGTEGILSGNPDLAGVLTIAERASAGQSFALLRRLARRYDLALSTQTG